MRTTATLLAAAAAKISGDAPRSFKRSAAFQMPMTRVAWLATVGLSLLVALLVLLAGYTGYALLSVAVAAAAAVNLT